MPVTNGPAAMLICTLMAKHQREGERYCTGHVWIWWFDLDLMFYIDQKPLFFGNTLQGRHVEWTRTCH